MDQCQHHENFWAAGQSSELVNWVKTKPRLAVNQIPFSEIHGVGLGPLSKILAVKESTGQIYRSVLLIKFTFQS